MSKQVFFNAVEGSVEVTIDGTTVGTANTGKALARLLEAQGVTLADSLQFNSDVDFASEAGLAADSAAQAIIDAAIVRLQKT